MFNKSLILYLLFISNIFAGWMNVDSINIKQKFRNKKFNTDALLYIKSADSLLDTCNIYSVSNNIGIGINTPSALLDVNGTSEFNDLLTVEGVNGGIDLNRSTGEGFINFRDGSGVGNWTFKHYNTNNVLRMYSAGINGILYISKLFTGTDFTFNTANGRLGIGTASPSSLLHVYGGSIQVQNTYTTSLSETKLDFQRDGGNYISAIAGTNGALTCQTRLFQRWQVNDTTRMYLNNAGYLGIGTDNPVYPLQLHRTTTDNRIAITNSTSGAGIDHGLNLTENTTNAYIRNWENGFLTIGTNGDDNITILPSGFIGIATTSPEYLLDISYGGDCLIFGADEGLYTKTDNTNKRGIIKGTCYDTDQSDVHLLSYRNDAFFNTMYVGGGLGNKGPSRIQFSTSPSLLLGSSYRMVIDSSGHVGIGILENPKSILTIQESLDTIYIDARQYEKISIDTYNMRGSVAGKPDSTIPSGNFYQAKFDAVVQQGVSGSFGIPNAAKKDTIQISIDLFNDNGTAGNYVFQFRYKLFTIGSAAGSGYDGTLTATKSATSIWIADTCILGRIGISANTTGIMFSFDRLASNGSDTGGDVLVPVINFEYKVNSLGNTVRYGE